MLIGYARISKADGSQSLDLQRDALREAGVSDDAIYEDQASGQREDRPGLAAFLKAARQGDVIVVWRLDRLGRNLRHLVNLVQDLNDRDIGIRVLAGQGASIDTTTASGKFVFALFAALAEFERELIREQDLYDQTLILVNGDHGSQWVSPLVKSRTGSIVQTQIITSANPLLFVKPRETRGSLRFSNAPVSIGDIPATVNRAFGLDGDFPGIPIFDISESDERERIYLWYKPRPEVFMEQKLPRTMPYRILGNLFNQYDWIPPYLSDLEKAPSVLPMDHENLHEFAQGFSCRRPKLQHNPISGNIPLAEAIARMVGLASRGMIEFLRQKDPVVQELHRFREDVFPNYTQENFLREFQTLASVEWRETSSSTGRLLVKFSPNPRDVNATKNTFSHW